MNDELGTGLLETIEWLQGRGKEYDRLNLIIIKGDAESILLSKPLMSVTEKDVRLHEYDIVTTWLVDRMNSHDSGKNILLFVK